MQTRQTKFRQTAQGAIALVLASDGKRRYRVQPDGQCDCPDYRYRRQRRGETCKHFAIAQRSAAARRLATVRHGGQVQADLTTASAMLRAA